MDSDALSKPLKKKVGVLLADFLKECVGDSVPGLAEASADLRKGDLNEGFTQVRTFLKDHAPLEQIAQALSSQFGEGSAEVVRELHKGKYGPAVSRLVELSRRGNIYVCEPTDFAKALCGSYFGHVEGLSQESSGLITRVAAYGDVPGYEKFTSAKPGTIGVYKRGRTTVGTITVHKPGEVGCVSLWAMTLDDQKLGQKDIVDAFDFEEHIGELVSRGNLHVGLRDSSLKHVAGYRVKKEKINRPGLGAYKLELVR